MFVAQEVALHLGYKVACGRLLGLVSGDWLTGASGQAFAEGWAGMARVGPFGGVPGVSKLVRVRFLPPQPGDQLTCVPLRWEATGRTGALFPVLDADTVLLPAGEGTRLVLSGSYRPPLGSAGATVDKLVMHRGGGAGAAPRVVASVAGPLA